MHTNLLNILSHFEITFEHWNIGPFVNLNALFCLNIFHLFLNVILDLAYLTIVPHLDAVTLAIGLFQMIWSTVGYEKTIYHYSNFIT